MHKILTKCYQLNCNKNKMNESVWLQLVITVGGVATAMFATIRYSIAQNNKKDKGFLDYLEKMQTQQLEYYETKNGHIERISKSFSNTMNKNTRAIDNLATQVKMIPNTNPKKRKTR